jgi:hypothetical protein
MGIRSMSDQEVLHEAYENIKSLCAKSYSAKETRDAIRNLCQLALEFMAAKAEFIELISKVPGKEYASYRYSGSVARPANKALFISDPPLFGKYWDDWGKGTLSDKDRLCLLYTAALAPCLAMELFDKQNKKGPATYFECFIGNLVATQLKRDPSKKAALKIGKANVRLTMDFLFEGDKGKAGIHLPVKMSTRERVVQAWAHQKLLDSAFGKGAFLGLMILFSETKLDSRTLEVVEICVPDQWLAYQTHLAKMDEIFYFDLPDRYLQLAKQNPTLIKLETIEKLIR